MATTCATLLWVVSSALATDHCPEKFSNLAAFFSYSDLRERFFEEPHPTENFAIFIGRGTSAVTHLVLNSKTGKPWVRKTYAQVSEGYPTSREDAVHNPSEALRYPYVNDLGVMRHFNEIAARSDLGFQFASVQTGKMIGNQYAIYMNFVRGRPLHSLLTDAGISEELKNHLRQLYLERLEKLEAAIQHENATAHVFNLSRIPPEARYFSSRKTDGLPMLNGWDELNRVLIKSDNVIVDPYDLTMTIVDPF